jgi:hypothetical protein
MWYGTETLQVVPYMEGTPVYKDETLTLLYQRTRDEDKLETVFCGDKMSHDAFVSFFHQRKTMQVLCEVEPDKEKNLHPVGYSWVDLPKGIDGARSAHAGFCFFDHAGKRGSARALGCLGIAYWIKAMRITSLIGVLLESNVAAKNFAEHLGYVECAVIPEYHFRNGKLEGARIMHLSAERFLPVFNEWRERNPVAGK